MDIHSTGPRLIGRPIAVKAVNFCDPPIPEAQALFNLLRRRFDLVESENPEVLFCSRFRRGRHLHRPYDCLKVFYSGECDQPRPHEADLSLTFDPDSACNIRLPFWRLRVNNGVNTLGLLFEPWEVEAEIAAKTDFCNFVYSNAAAKNRIQFFHLLAKRKPVNAGGKVLNNVGGPVADKLGFLRRHKFTIAFENRSHPGYTTEKMTEAMAARTVPIYWGNPNAAEDFNPKAFINAHDFKSLEALAEFVAQVDGDDALYRGYMQAIATEPINGGMKRIAAMDERLFAAFKKLVENPPVPRASQRLGNRLARGLRRFF